MLATRRRVKSGAGFFRGKVVVITGGSAGVGRAAARAFAYEGATVALLARDPAGLEGARAEIEALGGRAAAFPVDVADAEAVLAAARAIEERLGAIEIWVNNAMVTVFSPVADLAADEVRRVTEVTYLGYVHGTLAALRHMRPRDRGVIVQVGSSLSYRGLPLQAAYCGARHAERGFTDSLRSELIESGSSIRLTAVHLPAVNTPQFDWARTRTGRMPRPVAPVYAARVAARAILHAARRPAREYWLGSGTPVLILGDMLFPGLFDRLLAARAVEGQQTARDIPPGRRDNLFRPVPGGHRTDGSFGGEAHQRSLLYSGTGARVGALVGLCLASGLLGLVLGRFAGRRSGPVRGRHRRRRQASPGGWHRWLRGGSA